MRNSLFADGMQIFGREYSLDSLTKLCFATTEGVSLLGINEAANTLGLHTTCARATTMVLGEVPLPCILHWNQNHFVVLYKVKKGKNFYVADPGKGLVTYSLEEFKQHWVSTKSNGEDNGYGLYMLDKELGARVYTQAAPLANKA